MLLVRETKRKYRGTRSEHSYSDSYHLNLKVVVERRIARLFKCCKTDVSRILTAEIVRFAARQQSDPPGYLPPYSTQRPPEKPRPFQAPSTSQQPTYTTPTQNQATNYPYQRPSPNVDSSSGQSTVQSSPFSTQRSTYLPPNNQSPYVPSSYNPRPTTTPSYSNAGSSAFPPYSSTPQQPSASAGISTSYGYSTPGFTTSAPGRFSTPSGFSTTYGYSTQRPSPTYVPSAQGSAFNDGYTITNGYPTAGAGANSYDQSGTAGYPSSPSSYPSSTPGGAFPPQNTGSAASGTNVVKPPGTSSTGVATGPGGEGELLLFGLALAVAFCSSR